jgi:predicted aspartyl protease
LNFELKAVNQAMRLLNDIFMKFRTGKSRRGRFHPAIWFLLICPGILAISANYALAQSKQPDEISRLKQFYDRKQYFELRDAVENYHGKTDDRLLFFRGAVANKFNKSQLSINYTKRYLRLAKEGWDRHLLIDSYAMLADDYKKIYQYRQAAAVYKTILVRFKSDLKAEDAEDYENSYNLWNALKDVPPQSVSFNGSSVIQTSRDKADLTEFPLKINGQQLSLVLDTGANISTVSASYARKLGLQIIETAIDVGSSTGRKSKAKLGIAKEVKIGSATARNVVFLIFDDQAMYISELSLQLNGYIGFPLLEALREIIFSRDGTISIPARPEKDGVRNMCLEELSPLIEGEFEGQRLVFSLDTGANTSDLYPLFYQAHEEEIKAKYLAQTSNRGGVGGTTKVPAYLAKDLVIKFPGKDAIFPTITILTTYSTDNSHYFYGNLGQDLVRQFEKMTLNFESMSLKFD